MRASPLLVVLPVALALAACGQDAPEPVETVELDGADDGPAPAGPAQGGAGQATPAPDDTGATPMDERVATLGLLNKRNNVSRDIELSPGESFEDGPVIVTLRACERTAPYEFPQETGAFVQVDVRDRRADDHRRIFSGWLFKESPSLNVVEHPIYDVWVKDCAMAFPGDE